MTYSSGGLIQASDYNTFAAGATTNASTNLNYVLSTGNGAFGLGQTAVSGVSAGGLVTASQWATLINTLNNVRNHQSGAGTGTIGAPTAGSTVTYLSSVTASLSSAYTNTNSFAAQGSTTTGGNYAPNPTAGVNTGYGEATVAARTVSFASADAARYFFNAGGQLNYYVTSIANNDGSSRSAGIAGLGTPSVKLRNTTASVNGGSYLTGNGSNAYGYRSLPTSPVVITQLTESGTYSGDFIKIYLATNGINSGGNGDYGSAITFYYNLYSAGHGAWNTALNITVNHQVDIVYPETTYLTTTWGTPSVS